MILKYEKTEILQPYNKTVFIKFYLPKKVASKSKVLDIIETIHAIVKENPDFEISHFNPWECTSLPLLEARRKMTQQELFDWRQKEKEGKKRARSAIIINAMNELKKAGYKII